MKKKQHQAYTRESDFIADVVLNFIEVVEILDLPAVLNIEQEKIIAPFNTTTRSRRLPRVDLLVTHMDNEITIIEAKVLKSIHDMTQGIAQLLTYRQYAESFWKPKRINLVLIANEITDIAPLVIQRYDLPIYLLEFGAKTIASARLKKYA